MIIYLKMSLAQVLNGSGWGRLRRLEQVVAILIFVRSQEVRWKNEFEFDETAIITSGDGVGVGKIFHFYEGKYALHQRAYRIHVVSNDFLPKYVFYYMKNGFLKYIEKNAFQSSVTSIRRPMLLNFQLPLISLAEQERIVAILDRFDSLCNSLTEGLPAEIELRKKQYEYYRDKLLSFGRASSSRNSREASNSSSSSLEPLEH